MIVLASASPRRRSLLQAAGLAFEIVPSDVPEDLAPGTGSQAGAAELARDILAVHVVPAGNLVQLGKKPGGEAATAVQRAQALVDHCAAFVAPQ